MNKPSRTVLRKIAYSLYSFSAALLIAGAALPLIAPPALAAPDALAPGYVVQFDSSDYSVCIYTETTLTASGSVTLPAGETATLQMQWYIQNPPDLRTEPVYSYTNDVKDGDKFSITATWPGIRLSDAVVEIHYGAILLDQGGSPLSDGAGLDVFWYPYVCTVPPAATSTPLTPSPTATETATPIPTETATPTASSTAPAGVTPTLTATPIPTETATPTPTVSSTAPAGVTPTLTATSGASLTPTPPASATPTATGVTPTEPVASATVPAGVTPTLTATLPARATPTRTAVPTLPAPAAAGTPAALIPVTGADLAGPAARFPLTPGMLTNIGFALLGLAIACHGLSLR